MQDRLVRAVVGDRDPAEDVFGRSLRVLDDHVEVAVAFEDARIEQLVFRILTRAPAVLRDEAGIRKRALRILVQYSLTSSP